MRAWSGRRFLAVGVPVSALAAGVLVSALAAGVLVSALAAGVLASALAARGAGERELPPPRAQLEATASTYEDFVGAETCGECHVEQYRAWRASTHGRAGGPPDPDRLLTAFDGRPIRFADAVLIPAVGPDGEYRLTVEREGRPPVVFRLDGVIGGGRMVGGGTQGFVSRSADGTLRFLPFEFIRREGVWFCNTSPIAGWWVPAGGLGDLRADEGFVPITEELELTDCGDWPPTRILGSDLRYANCQDCHGSQVTVRFDAELGRYETRLVSLAVNCESCHGPGREHVQRARERRLEESDDPGIEPLALLDEDASLEVCFRCHALKRVLEPGYLPGGPFPDHYSLKAPLLGDRPFFPDGRVRTFAYQQNHLYSDCYLSGTMSCVDCHEPHAQGYRDVHGKSLEGRFSDGQCVGCHPSKGEDAVRHTHHAADSPGSRCIACHMPYRQQPLVGSRLRYARADHTIPVPRPAWDRRLGVESVCRSCHAEATVEEIEEQMRGWWGELKPVDRLVAALAGEGGEVKRAASLAALLGRPGVGFPMVQVAALNHLLQEQLRPEMADLDAETKGALRRLAESADPDVRSVALAALHLVAGHDEEVRDFLARRLRALGDKDRAVRRRWVAALSLVAETYRTRGEGEAAVVAYSKALEVLPEDPTTLLSLGSAYAALGDHPAAVQQYQRALAADPHQPVALVNLGISLEALGRTEEAESAYRRAVGVKPSEALAHLNLGNLHLRRGEARAAIREYREAVRYEPGLARAHLYLALAYIRAEKPDSALPALYDALEFEPGNPDARRLLDELGRPPP